MEVLQFLNPLGSTTKGRRSKRPRHTNHAVHSWAEDETACSSLSEEEDLANCLVMLSSAQPPSVHPFGPFGLHGAGNPQGPRVDTPPVASNSNVYQCKKCNKNFHSYQALGGHSASHSKFKSCNSQGVDDEEAERVHRHSAEAKQLHRTRIRIHECSVCHRVFDTGQALGGHMRSHSAPSAASATTGCRAEQQRPLMSGLLDLNMPPALDDDGDGCRVQLDDSALSCGDVEGCHWPGPVGKIGGYFTPPWWVDAGNEARLFVYDGQQSDESDASSAAQSGMYGVQHRGSVLVATVNYGP